MPPKQAYRGGGRGRGDHNGNGGNTKKDFEKPAETHAERAAQLLERARAAATTKKEEPRTSAPLPSQLQSNIIPPQTDGASNAPIALPVVLKSLVNPALGTHAFRVKEAIPLAGKLVRAKLNTPVRLAHLNAPVLEEAGITGQHDKDRILMAFGVRAVGEGGGSGVGSLKRALAGASSSASATSTSTSQAQQAKRRRRAMDDEALSREYGNVRAPDDSAAERGQGAEQIEYTFHEVLDEASLRGRFALVNRAPIMTAWSTIVLERLGFQRREALSLAHCYVNTTSTARGISLGIIPASERQRAVHTVGSNQPHFTLMGVKIPLMKLSRTDEWRGISKGEVVGPDVAFNYMRKSMYQTLPLVLGALTLLADSYVNASDEEETTTVKAEAKTEQESATHTIPNAAFGPDTLHDRAYELYAQFRPATAGEWGKKSMFYCSKALALRRGFERDLALWEKGEREREEGGDEQEAQLFEEELRALVKAEGGGGGGGAPQDASGPLVTDATGDTIKTEAEDG